MFDGRIYRAALVPLLLVVVIVGFSLTGSATELQTTLAPDAFDGGRAYSELQTLVRRFPNRRPGSAGDEALAAYVAGYLRELGGAGGGYAVSTHSFRARTAEGERTLTDVVAVRPGSTGERAIAIVAHRDAVGSGATAELSGTAALLELARVFSQSETRRTVILASTSGGSEGYAGAARLGSLQTPVGIDAALVLGDLAGQRARQPFVLPFSGAPATAPAVLERTLRGAISQEVGTNPGSIDLVSQLAHLAFPLASAEQTVLGDAGVPAVLLDLGGQRTPGAGEGVSQARLANFARAALSAAYALDEGGDVPAPSVKLQLGNRELPAWAIRLLALALLLAPALVCIDALARLRRRREAIARPLVWALGGSTPFLAAALFAALLGAFGIVPAPSAQLSSVALSVDGGALPGLVATLIVMVLSPLAWPVLARGLGLSARPGGDAAGLAAALVLLACALVVWALNPFAALLLAPAAHLGLLAADPRGRVLPLVGLGLALLPLGLLCLVYSHELGLGPLAFAESVVLLLAGGQVGLLAALLWSLALGSLLALLAHVLAPIPIERSQPIEPIEISTRGPLGYAGPGSLGGTKSALRR
ncbi:MAG TPA: M28 family peptidase [Solirubrobacteraceae bacterium]|jgi:hypothetical protein|nr:M28 family peptidase [Solirubrobacteraceae bacterium]